jgi:hypothetical protein
LAELLFSFLVTGVKGKPCWLSRWGEKIPFKEENHPRTPRAT